MVGHSTFGLSSLKIGRLTFTLRSLPILPALLLSLDPLVMVDLQEHHSLPWSELPPPEEGYPLEVSLSTCVVPCLLWHPLHLPTCWEWVFLCSVTWLLISSFLTSALEASSSKPCIHSLMLYAAVGIWFVFVVPWGCSGPLALVLFPMMVSVMAQWPSWTVLIVISTWASLPTQLTGPPKWNPTSLASLKGSHSLSYYQPKNKIASPGVKTTASVCHSSGPSWNMSAINKLVHAWGGEDWLPAPSPKVTLTWMQLHIWSSCAGLLCQCSGDKDHSDGDLPCHIKWKSVLEEAPIYDTASSNDATLSLKSWTKSPVLPDSLTWHIWNDGDAPLSVRTPFGSIFMLSHGIMEVLCLHELAICTEITDSLCSL